VIPYASLEYLNSDYVRETKARWSSRQLLKALYVRGTLLNPPSDQDLSKSFFFAFFGGERNRKAMRGFLFWNPYIDM